MHKNKQENIPAKLLHCCNHKFFQFIFSESKNVIWILEIIWFISIFLLCNKNFIFLTCMTLYIAKNLIKVFFFTEKCHAEKCNGKLSPESSNISVRSIAIFWYLRIFIMELIWVSFFLLEVRIFFFYVVLHYYLRRIFFLFFFFHWTI